MTNKANAADAAAAADERQAVKVAQKMNRDENTPPTPAAGEKWRKRDDGGGSKAGSKKNKKIQRKAQQEPSVAGEEGTRIDDGTPIDDGTQIDDGTPIDDGAPSDDDEASTLDAEKNPGVGNNSTAASVEGERFWSEILGTDASLLDDEDDASSYAPSSPRYDSHWDSEVEVDGCELTSGCDLVKWYPRWSVTFRLIPYLMDTSNPNQDAKDELSALLEELCHALEDVDCRCKPHVKGALAAFKVVIPSVHLIRDHDDRKPIVDAFLVQMDRLNEIVNELLNDLDSDKDAA